MIAENKSLKCINDNLEKRIKQNIEQSNNSENYSRRNIVVRGIVEVENETNEKCEEELRKFLCTKLNMSAETVDALRIERCHRMGGKKRGAAHQHKRPLIVRFSGYKDKSAVWSMRSQLTGHDYSMSENSPAARNLTAKSCTPCFKRQSI